METLAAEGQPLGVSELAQRIGGARGTVHKQLAGLVSSGWVQQDPDGRYGLTLKVARIGNAALEQAGLGERIYAILEQIAAQARETVSIAALADDTALIIQRVQSDQVLHANIRVGTPVTLDGGASGLVLAAFGLDKARRDGLRDSGVPIAPEARLSRVRKAGFAHTVDKVAAGVSAVSVPLHDAWHTHTMALTLSGPNDRLDPVAAERLLCAGRELIAAVISGRSIVTDPATVLRPSG